MLFQRFAERKTPLADFLDSFLKSRKLQHMSIVLVKKLQEFIEFKSRQTLCDNHPDTQMHNVCLPVCGLTTAVVLPTCCHPSLLLPCGAHINTSHCLQQHSPFCHDYCDSVYPRVHRRGPKWPVRPVRLQPLKVQRRQEQEHQQEPQ